MHGLGGQVARTQAGRKWSILLSGYYKNYTLNLINILFQILFLATIIPLAKPM